jgi:predicted nucleic acid-binding protein
MKSIDTNLLVHALDRSSPYHDKALPLYEQLMTERGGGWVIADQTLFELYRAVRNPSIFERPLSAGQATRLLEQIRDRSAAVHCAYDARLWPKVLELLRRFPDRKGILVFDAVVAVTIHAKGVRTFYTRNTADFRDFGFFDVVDPTSG